MRGIILCVLLLLAIPAVGAAPDACNENTLPGSMRAACMLAPAIEDNRIVIGGELMCAGGVRSVAIDAGPTGAKVYVCSLQPL